MSNLSSSLPFLTVFGKRKLLIIFCLITSLIALKLSAHKPVGPFHVGMQEGDIMFVAYNGDGDDGFAIVALVDIPGSSTVYFNENEWNGSGIGSGGAYSSNTEGEITWSTGGSEIPAGTVVTFDEVDNAGNTNYGASVGTISGTFALGTTNEVIYAFIGTDDETPTTFLSAIANDEFNATSGQLTNTGLVAGVDAVNIDGDEDVMAYTGSTVCDGTQAQCAAQIANVANWTTQDATGDQDADFTIPDFPGDVPGTFTGSYFTPVSNVAISITSQTNVDCNGATTGALTATASDGTSPYTYLWSTSAGTASISSLAAATYTVTVTDDNGTTATASATLTQPTALVASTTIGSPISCNGAEDGQIQASQTGGTAPYTYSWNNGATNAAGDSDLSAGTYTVTIQDANGCTSVSSTEITQPEALVASAEVTTPISCNGAEDGALTASQTGGTAPYTYSWNNGGTAALENHSISAATYSVTITDANGCTSATSVEITEPAVLGASSVVDMNVSINGGSDGQATALGSGGTAPYTYSWNEGSTTATATGLFAGTYTVSITDANGCGPATSQLTITEPTALSVSAVTDNNVSCNGDTDGQVTASGSGGTSPYTYSWNEGSTSATATSLTASTYTITLTDANGATATSSTTVTEPVAIGAGSVVDQNVSINGGSDGQATALGSGGTAPYTYSWNEGSTTATATGLFAGTYTVSITDANGCGPATSQLTITEPTALSVSAVTDNNVSCNGDTDGQVTASGSGGTSPYTYSWNEGSTSATATSLTASTYTITLTDANGATATSSTTVTEPVAIGAGSVVDQNVSINGGSDGQATALGSGGTAPYTYSWNEGSTTATATGLFAGTYTVSITDANGCGPATSQLTITEPTALSVSAVTDNNVSCNGDTDGQVTASGSGGTSPYTYSWNEGSTSATATSLTASTYTITLTDANGATATSSTTVTEPVAIGAGSVVDQNVSINGGSDGQATALGSGGTAPYTYSWNEGSTTATATGLFAGTYTVSITDANGCGPATSQLTITEPTALSVSAVTDNNVSCNGDTDGQVTASGSGGTSPYTYSWNEGSTSATATSLTASTYTITLTDANGATATSSTTVTEPVAIGAGSVVDQNVSINGGSDGQATALGSGGTAPYTYSWNEGSTTATATGLFAGTYTVSITDANGCGPATSQLTITEPTALSVSAVTDNNVSCNGDTDGQVTASGSGGTSPYTYSWNEGSTSATATSLTASTYTITLTDANGATATSSTTVTEPVAIGAGSVVDQNVSINGGSDGQATALGSGGTAPYTYSWNEGSTTATATGLFAGTYTVSITDANGCGPATSQVSITEPTALSVSAVTDNNVSCNGDTDGQVTASGSGGTSPYTYSWNEGSTSATATSLTASTYTITLTDANGATATSSTTVTEPVAIGASSVVDMNVSINGGSDGQVTASGSGGTGAYTYSWNTGSTSATTSGLPAGTYTVSITDANGCGPATSQVSITEPTALSVSAVTDNNVSCNGDTDGQVTASGSGGTSPYTYSWNEGSTSATATSLTASTYTITLTDANGATATSSTTVTQPAALVAASIVDFNVAINGGSDGGATASATGGTAPYTYAWSNGATNASITGATAGTYTVSITDNNGCGPATSQVSITEPAVLVAASVIDFNVDCNGGSDGGATASATGGTQPYTYTWSNGATNASISGSVAGTYTVTITDNNGGTATSSATITQPAALVAASIVDFNVAINGGSDGGATASATGGTAPYTYTWSNGATNASITGATAGTYTVSITDNNGCGPATSQVSITEPAVLVAASVIDFNVDCNGGSDGGATASATGGTQPYTYTWSNGATNASISGSVAGTYTVTITDNNGGTATSSATITQPAALVAASIVDFNVAINGGSDGGATASATGGTAPYTYTWSNGATNASITGATAGTYTVSITDNNGCGPATSQVSITEPAVLVAASVIDFNVDCNGGSDGGATASATGGTQPYTYTWSNGATNASISGSVAGTYTVTITDNNGGTATSSATITQPAALVAASIVDFNVAINGGSDGGATASATGGTQPYTYAWSNGATNASITGATAGTYTVSITDNNGCGPATSQVSITEPAVLVAASVIDFNVDCNGGSDGGATASATGGTQPYTYAWSNGATNASISGSAAGTYTVTITDNNGGTATSSATITQPAALVAASIVDFNVAINGGSDGGATASATGGTAPYTYAWSNGATNASITGATAGTYTVSITDNNGCGPATSQVSITEPAVLVAASVIDFNVDCNGGSDGGATASATGGTQPYTYAWSNGATNASINGSAAGTYTVTITDNNGGTATSSATITQPAALVAASIVDFNVAINGGSDGGATASATGGTAPYTYAWSNGATNASITGATAGTYTVSITDNNGCGPATSQVSITEPAVLVAASVIDFNVDCNGGSDGGATASATGGTQPYTYAWSNGATNASINGSAAGTYTVTITDNNGGTATSSATITEPAALSASIAGSTIDDGFGGVYDETVSCNGGSDGGLTASSTGGTAPYTYTWSNSATTASIVGVGAGTYTVTVTDNNGCTTTSQGDITQPTVLSASIAGSTIEIEGEVHDETVSCNGAADGGLTASSTGGTAPYTYTWSNSATTASIVGVGAGTYTVTVTDNNGCTTTSQGDVTQPDALVAGANTDMNVSGFNGSDGEVSSTPTGGTSPYTYLWSTGSTSAAQATLSAGTYTITVTDANGCTAIQSTDVTQPPNSNPAFDSSPVTAVDDNETYLYLIETSDADGHDVDVSGSTIPSWMSLEEDVFAAVAFAGSPTDFDGDGSGTPGGGTDINGTGTDAIFGAPYGIEIDDSGNLYVADADFGLIRKITPEGVVSTFAGSGSDETIDGTGTGASFYGPAGLAIDDNGNLYVSEIGGNVIRKITSTGVVTTLAGSGTPGTGTGSGSGTGTFITPAMVDGTGTDAHFTQPYGMAIDDNGNIYVTDTGVSLIRKVTPAGVVTTLAGTGFVSGSGGPGSGTVTDGTGTEASFNFPLGIDIDSNGNLYVADAFNGLIRKVTPLGVVTSFIGQGIDFESGGGIGPVAEGTGTDAVFAGIPVGLQIDEFDNIYITQGFFGAPAILRADLNGVLETMIGGGEGGIEDGIGTDAQFSSSFDLVVDDFGNIYMSELEATRIRKVVFGDVLVGDPVDQIGDHPVVLDASDGNTGTGQQSFTVTVSDATPPEITSGNAVDFAENGTGTAYPITATDTNTQAVITYSLGTGNDESLFGIIGSDVSFLSAPDFETPTDGDQNNTYIIDVIAEDDSNNEISLRVTITVTDVQEDVTAPDKPVITGITDDTGSSNSDGITNDANIIISGTAEALSSVEVFTQFGTVRTTTTDANGDWSLDITDITLLELSFNLTAKATDLAGNTSAASDIFVLKPDYTAPAKPVINSITDDTGSSNSDGVTNDPHIIISGTAEALSSIELFTQFGSFRTTQTDGNGDWTLDITDVSLVELSFNLTAEATDLAGNTSATSDIFVLIADRTAPAKPVITGITDDTGSSNSDGVTNDANIIISGTAEALSSVEVSTQFGPVRTTQTDANGDWTLDITDLSLVELSFNLTAEATDLAGNTSAASDIFVLTPDFTAPAKPVINSITDDTGSSNSDGVTNDANIIISGTAEALSSVEVSTQFGPVRTTQTDANGDWTLDITDLSLVELSFNLTAEATDLAGNTSAASDIFVLTADRTAPAKPVINSITDDTGSSNSDGVTNDANIIISGTAEAFSSVEVFTQFGTVRTTQTDANGDWDLDITDITLVELSFNLTAKATDLAGNESAASDVFVLKPDFTAPSVSIDIENISVAGYLVTAIFDEEVSGLTLGEIAVANGTASALVQNSTTSYSFLINSSGSSADVTVNANSAEDQAGNGNTASNQLTLSFTPVSSGEDFTNLQSLSKTEEINIYPNPASRVLTIDLSELSAEEVDIYMYDAAGTPVFTRRAYQKKTLKLDVSDYNSGMYIVQFYDGQQVIRKKVMVKK